MSSVYLCSPTNSQMFTTCCRTAICEDQEKCPTCKQDVYPFWYGMSDKERREIGGGYYNSNVRKARWSLAYGQQKRNYR